MTMMNKPLSLALLLGTLLAATAAGATDADRRVDERRPLKANAQVSVNNVAGLIRVETWDRNELHLTGELSEEVEALEITGSDSSLKIKVKVPERTKNIGHTRLELKVPAGVSIDAQGVSADIDIQGLRGAVAAQTVSGDVRVDVASERVKAATVSGDVSVQAPSSSDTRAQSVSGDVLVRGVKGEVRAESVSGDVRVQAGELKRVDLESVSGDLHVEATLTRDSDVDVETLSGSVALVLPKLPGSTLEMETFSGGLTSDWSPGPRGSDKDFRQEGEGRGRVRLHSFSGDIELKKK
jgi:DUF4097 and DUF4098 domain-containing protein YvlB